MTGVLRIEKYWSMERQTHINTRLNTVLVLVCYKKICFNCLYMYEPLNTKHASENNGHLLHVFCIVCQQYYQIQVYVQKG